MAGPSHLVPSLRSRARALLTDARARELSRDDHVMHHMILAICASIYRAPDALASDKRPRTALGGAIGSHGCRSASSVLPFVPPSPHRRVAPLSRLSFCSGPAVAFARGRCWVDCACYLCGCAWSAHHPGILDAVTAVVSASSVLPCACPVVGRVHDSSSVHVTAVVLLRQRRVPAPSSGGSMTLHLSRLPFCFVSRRVPAPSSGGSMTLHLSRLPFCSVSPAVASGGVAGSTAHAIFVAAPSLPTTPAFGCCTAVVSASSVLPRRRAGP